MIKAVLVVSFIFLISLLFSTLNLDISVFENPKVTVLLYIIMLLFNIRAWIYMFRGRKVEDCEEELYQFIVYLCRISLVSFIAYLFFIVCDTLLSLHMNKSMIIFGILFNGYTTYFTFCSGLRIKNLCLEK